MSLIQVSEVQNSNQMEKKGFDKTLQMFKDENITPTNCHTQIHKYMKEKVPGINHQFDVRYFIKNIRKRLINAIQKKSYKILSKWVKSIGNHLWWACATSEGDVELLQEKCISILCCCRSGKNCLLPTEIYC